MNYALLREWLNLPPGPWPPPDRDLLGLPPDGAVDATIVEIKALERMDILRPRQLVQPDLVTEGMNRLAQAMIALTAHVPAAPAPARKPKKASKEATPVELRKPEYEVRLELETPAPRGTATATRPAVLDAEVIGYAVERVDDAIPESTAVQNDEPDLPSLDEPIAIPEPPPGTVVVPSPRRDGYRELVAYRTFRDAWDRFRPLLGDPSERLKAPAKIASYLEAVSHLRVALHKTRGTNRHVPDLAGHVVLSVVCHPVPLALLRDLVPSQRQILARDWAVAKAEIEAKGKRMRRAMNGSRTRRPFARATRLVANHLSRMPELILVAIIVLSVVVGFRRS